jgi:hypothetical protein
MHSVRIASLFALVALAVCGFGLALSACDTGHMWFYYTSVDAGVESDADADASLDVD